MKRNKNFHNAPTTKDEQTHIKEQVKVVTVYLKLIVRKKKKNTQILCLVCLSEHKWLRLFFFFNKYIYIHSYFYITYLQRENLTLQYEPLRQHLDVVEHFLIKPCFEV